MTRTIKDIPEHDRPREKLLRKGAPALSDQELLAVLLGKGTRDMDVMKLAGKLAKVIDEKGLGVRAEDLREFDGVGDAKATLLLAALEFARRRIKPDGAKIETPADLLPHVRHYADRKQEHFSAAASMGRTRSSTSGSFRSGSLTVRQFTRERCSPMRWPIGLRLSSSRTTTLPAAWSRRHPMSKRRSSSKPQALS